jgi:predicted aspartyl protease
MKKQSMNLFDLTEKQIRILNLIEEIAEETEGEIPDEVWDNLVISKEELNEKIEAYVFRLAEYKAQIEALSAQVEIWNKKIEKKERTITFLKAGLAEVAKRLGERNPKGNYSLSAGDFKVNFQFTHSVEIENEDLVPEKFKKYNLTIKNMTKGSYKAILKAIGLHEEDNEELIKIESKISKTAIKEAIVTDENSQKTNEFTISDSVPGAFIDNKKGFVKIY